MLKIYIARHGQDQDNEDHILNGQRDDPLTALGLAQAHELAAWLKDHNFTFNHIYSSPLERAYRTAVIIAEALALPTPDIFPDLIERNFGVMTGRKKSEIEALCAPDIVPTKEIVYFLKPRGGETFPELLVRAKRVLAFIKEQHQDGNILLATHGDIGKMIYAAYYGLDWETALSMFHLGNCELLELAPDIDLDHSRIFKLPQHNG